MVNQVLFQGDISATTETDIIDGSSTTPVVTYAIFICNRSGAGVSFRLTLARAGKTTAANQYLYYDKTVNANDTVILPYDFGLQAGDKMRFYASAADLTVTVIAAPVLSQ